MADERDVLEVLKFELNFLEQGGYGRSVRAPQRPTSMFQDSITCLNFGEQHRPHPCSECMLIDFVPQSARGDVVPCHHIPITPSGDTIETLEAAGNQPRMEEALIGWVRSLIERIAKERQSRTA